jgi:hypothetical protein
MEGFLFLDVTDKQKMKSIVLVEKLYEMNRIDLVTPSIACNN